MNKYRYLMLCIIALALPGIPASGQTGGGRFGFKGLHLGMSRGQIDSLIDATSWQVMYPSAATVDGHTDPNVMGELLHGEPGSAIAHLGCGPTSGDGECLDFENTLFVLQNGKVATIIVTTPEIMPPGEKSLQNGLGIVARYMTSEYGPPVAEPTEISTTDLRAIPGGKSRSVARWQHPSLPGEQIEVKVQRSYRKGYYISIVII